MLELDFPFMRQSVLFSYSCRLLVNLTQPAVICFGKVPKEKMERNQFLEVMSHLQSYKQVNLLVE